MSRDLTHIVVGHQYRLKDGALVGVLDVYGRGRNRKVVYAGADLQRRSSKIVSFRNWVTANLGNPYVKQSPAGGQS